MKPSDSRPSVFHEQLSDGRAPWAGTDVQDKVITREATATSMGREMK
jgi:hypothetical protein